ncbi:ParB/RepB/Spo0J family partition protein [Clostridium folliculivorans]|uniref:Chromosome partitioning protein ParB n=1 Tax=Clostridium folliculivorans TaxID=2886038 RepID=A0A9W5Y399_9CLOT|nr:ParB/RepB/Spo0J family partition protein [Clostridium folliculivorans]GKU25826.1 chromosome partitioning protein ParB [Clostridium folliculivorans]GKU27912.1 chromosome partitioning protein ParB [Clostridium folliculivorans]
MNKKFGLGKGLSALIPEEDNENSDELTDKSATMIPLNNIKANESQPRRYFDNDKINELSESIKNHGIIQPLILKKENDNYTIIAGERRWRAAKQLMLKEVPAIVMDIDDKEILEISLIENIQREDLNAIEEAQAYERLLHEFSLTQEKLSERIGKSRTAISNTIRLLNLDKRVQSYIIEGVLSEGHGRAILALGDKDKQYEVAQKAIDESLSVRDVEKLIKAYLNKIDKIEEKGNEEVLKPYYKDIQEQLQDYFGTKVNINSKKNKGKIEIEYYSEEDLQRILEIINI